MKTKIRPKEENLSRNLRPTLHNFSHLASPMPISEQSWPKGTVPLVSTSTLTYQHGKYIRECIDGILMQRTTFPVRVVIFDDCSTDGTREIVKEYEAKYPHLIKGIYPEKNTYGKPERREALKPRDKARNVAKYIALCEGDDYWTDPLKLQKQVDFLEKNPDVCLSYHNRRIIDRNDREHKISLGTEDKIISENKLIVFVPTLTMLFKNFPEIGNIDSSGIFSGDFFLQSILSTKGNFAFHPFYGGVYRQHQGGVSTSKSLEKATALYIESRKVMIKRIPGIDKKQIYQSIFNKKVDLFTSMVRRGDFLSSSTMAISMIRDAYKSHNLTRNFRTIIVLYFKNWNKNKR